MLNLNIGKFHHIGIATREIKKELPLFLGLGYKKESEIFVDEIQKVRGLFIISESSPRLELLENSFSQGPLDVHLAKGNKFYHIAYEVNDIEFCFEYLIREYNYKPIVPIVKADYFEKICFLITPNMILLELVQLQKGFYG